MNTPPPDWCDLLTEPLQVRNGAPTAFVAPESLFHTNGRPHGLSREALRHWAWVVGEGRPGDSYGPTESHVQLGYVNPTHGFAHWRIQHDWIMQTERQRGDAWRDCTMVLRLYDVSYIDFNGFNAHSITDLKLPSIAGHMFYHLPRPGTSRIGEVGFRLRSGEFVPAVRSPVIQFPADSASHNFSHAAIYVGPDGQIEEIGNIWDQASFLAEKAKPHVRPGLRIATFAFESAGTGGKGSLADFVAQLAEGQAHQGHEVHVFVPANPDFTEPRAVGTVTYHPLDFAAEGTIADQACAFAQAADAQLQELPPFDLIHCHEWITGLLSTSGAPRILSVQSTEIDRRNGAPASDLSQEIEQFEREAAKQADCILTPHGARDRAADQLAANRESVFEFPMEARLPNEWDGPLDFGAVKRDLGFGPLDRMIIFVGPLEHAAGVDLLVEAMPTMLARVPNLRLAYAGTGSMHGHLEHRARQLRVDYAVRLLGHVDRHRLTHVIRASEAMVLPSRFRVPWDDAVVDLARLAGRPVVTTHAGPAFLIQHEQNGLITYDNPGSMVWALDRLLFDPEHAAQMGRNGKRYEGASPVSWDQVAQRYLDLCAERFPKLRKTN
jgi:glycosyltransferase involved in cell wall biosynthesis